jgi:hypothetical protein
MKCPKENKVEQKVCVSALDVPWKLSIVWRRDGNKAILLFMLNKIRLLLIENT